MKILSSLHDPKKERYAVYYSVILLSMIAIISLFISGVFDINPIEGGLMFFEGFVALFMLIRHEKVSHSFSNHISQLNSNIRNCFSQININSLKKD